MAIRLDNQADHPKRINGAHLLVLRLQIANVALVVERERSSVIVLEVHFICVNRKGNCKVREKES